LQFEFGEFVAKLGVDTIGGVGQDHPAGHLGGYGYANLVEGNFRFGLKFDRFGHIGLLPSRAILGPVLRQIKMLMAVEQPTTLAGPK